MNQFSPILNQAAAIPLFALLMLGGLESNPVAQIQTQPLQGSIGIDRDTFLATLPSYMAIGQNYTVLARLTSSLQSTVYLTVELVVPLNYMLVQPLVNQFYLAPGETTTVSFTLIAYQTHVGGLDVTAEVWATNATSGAPTSPIMKLGGHVFVINRSGSESIGAAFAVILIALTLVFVYWRIARRG